MATSSCVACDYKLDANRIKVKIADKTVQVCCPECAQKLKDAQASSTQSPVR